MSEKTAFYSPAKHWGNDFFPYGFPRSGEFTLQQARLLEDHGRAYEALASGAREPMNKEEKAFVAFCRGERAARTVHEKVWQIYLSKLQKKGIRVSSLGYVGELDDADLALDLDEE